MNLKGKEKELTFTEVIGAFSTGGTLQAARELISQEVDSNKDAGKVSQWFDKVLEWCVAQGLLVQLGKYYHFLPGRAERSRGRAERSRDPTSLGVTVNKLSRELRPHPLSEDDLRLLASRADEDVQRLFLCRFVVKFAKAHCRVDGCKYAAFVQSFAPDLQQAQKLVDENSDILVPYTCWC